VINQCTYSTAVINQCTYLYTISSPMNSAHTV
jgi:hypothetical protein